MTRRRPNPTRLGERPSRAPTQGVLSVFRLARLSLANRAVVSLLALLIAGAGLFSMFSLKQELIPSISFPVISVATVSPGASPEVVDEQISSPLSDALKNVDGVESVVSTSSSSLSTISLTTEFGVDQDALKAAVQSAVDSVTTLPDGAEPRVVAGSLADLPVISLTASSDATIDELYARLDSIAVPALAGVDGVREVTLAGGTVYQVTITPDFAALALAGLSISDITDALKNNGITIPVGNVETGGVSVPVQGGTSVSTIADIEALPLAAAAEAADIPTIGSVSTVEVAAEPATSITRTNGEPSLSLSITALPDANLVSISHAVTAQLADLEDELGDGTSLTVVFDQAPFIEESIGHLATEGLLGLLFAVLVILVFLLSVRSTIVTAVSIPLSILVTFLGLNLGGFSLNMLTLGALTIAIGRVVDDSIVVIENIKRHLSYGTEKKQAILDGVKEVAGAITASTLTTIMVFRPFAITVVIAMASSLLVALTVVPVLAFWFLKTKPTDKPVAEIQAAAEEKEGRSRLQRAYVPILKATQRRPVITLVSAVLLLAITGALVPLLKLDFLGSSGQNSINVTQTFESGTDIEEISEVAGFTERAIIDTPGVESVQLTAGGSGGFFSTGGGDATFQITTDPDADQAEILDDLGDAIADLDAAADITVGAASAGFGSSTVDVIVTAGDDSAALTSAADAVAEALEDTPHVDGITSDRTADAPSIQINVDRLAAIQAGLTEMQIVGLVASYVTPSSVGTVRIDGSDLDIFVETGLTVTTLDELRDLSIPTLAGLLPLSELASVDEVEVPSAIKRDGGELIATISLTPEEGELGAVNAAVQERLDDLDLPSGVVVKLGGVSSQQTDAFGQLGLAMIAAIAIVYLLMVATFRSLVQPLVLLVSIPFAATGAIGLLLATGRPLGIASLIGFLMLIGIVVTNAIVLIDLVNQYRKQGQSVADAVINGARQRLRPILMTALATIFALTPMALGVTGSGGFISQDLAIVVIGGLVSSTVLTLILVPVLYKLIEGRRERKLAARA
jgi:hydrophobic/amphiphilic exporter-1 (mainly G- bacteria), HAE1 family